MWRRFIRERNTHTHLFFKKKFIKERDKREIIYTIKNINKYLNILCSNFSGSGFLLTTTCRICRLYDAVSFAVLCRQKVNPNDCSLQRRRGLRRHLSDERRRKEQWDLLVRATRYIQEHLQDRHYLVSLWRSALRDEIRLLDVRRLSGEHTGWALLGIGSANRRRSLPIGLDMLVLTPVHKTRRTYYEFSNLSGARLGYVSRPGNNLNRRGMSRSLISTWEWR